MGHGLHHIATTAGNFKVLIYLFILTGLTVWAPSWELGTLAPVVAFAIASTKAYFVLAFFMHLKYDSKDNIAIIGSTLFFLLLLLFFSVLDIATRPEVISPL